MIKVSVPSEFRLENQWNLLVRVSTLRGRISESGIGPCVFRWVNPLCGAAPIRILDDDAHTGRAKFFACLTQDPDAGTVHDNEQVEALGGGEPDRGHARRVRNRVAIAITCI